MPDRPPRPTTDIRGCDSRPGLHSTRLGGGRSQSEERRGRLPIWEQICRACDLLGRAEAVEEIVVARVMMEAQWR